MAWRYNPKARFETYDMAVYNQRQKSMLNAMCRTNAVLVFYSKTKVSKNGVKYQLAHLHDDDKSNVEHLVSVFKKVR